MRDFGPRAVQKFFHHLEYGERQQMVIHDQAARGGRLILEEERERMGEAEWHSREAARWEAERLRYELRRMFQEDLTSRAWAERQRADVEVLSSFPSTRQDWSYPY